MALLGFLVIGGVVLFLLAGERKEDLPPPMPLTTKDKEVSVQKTEKEVKENQPIEDKKIFRNALLSRNTDMCQEIQNQKVEDECWDAILLSKAVQETRQSHCEKMRDESRKQYCLDQVALGIVKLQNDFSRCQQIVSKTIRQQCHELEARSKIMKVTSISDCSDIPTEREKKLCEDFFTAKKIQEKKVKNKKDCQEFSNIEDQNQCELNFAIEKAEKDFDPSSCRALRSSDMQKTCIRQVQQKLQMKETTTFMSSGNVEGCDSIADEEMKQYCRDRAITARALKDYSPFSCKEIKNKVQQETCITRATNAANVHFFNMAKTEGDAKWCQFIPDKEAKKSCQNFISSVQ